MHFVARLNLLVKTGLVASIFVLSACEQPKPETAPVEQVITQPVVQEPLSLESEQQLKAFQQAANELPLGLAVCTETLATLGQQFLDQVTADNLELVKVQWQGCMETYQASQALQGFTPEHQTALDAAHQNLGNPLEMPGYIDSVEGYPHSGIVNDSSLPLDEENLRQQHGLTDVSDVSIGYHVIGFLLWGEQRYKPELEARSHEMFFEQEFWEDSRTDLPIAEHPNNRRRKLLQLTLKMAVEDSAALQDTWINGALPGTEKDSDRWIRNQLGIFKATLDQETSNEQLDSHLQSWIEQGLLPGVKVAQSEQESEPSATDLKQLLNMALTTSQQDTHAN